MKEYRPLGADVSSIPQRSQVPLEGTARRRFVSVWTALQLAAITVHYAP